MTWKLWCRCKPLSSLRVTPNWGEEEKSQLGVRAAIHRGQDRLEANGNFTEFSRDKCKVRNSWWWCRLGSSSARTDTGAHASSARAAGPQPIHPGTGLSPCSQGDLLRPPRPSYPAIPLNSVRIAHVYLNFTEQVNRPASPHRQQGRNSNSSPRLRLFKIFQMRITSCERFFPAFKVFSISSKLLQLCKTLPAHFWQEVKSYLLIALVQKD